MRSKNSTKNSAHKGENPDLQARTQRSAGGVYHRDERTESAIKETREVKRNAKKAMQEPNGKRQNEKEGKTKNLKGDRKNEENRRKKEYGSRVRAALY